MHADMAYYVAAVSAVVLFGLSKGGFSGVNAMAIPLLTLVISPVRAAAILLPILIVQDWVSIWAFRRDFNVRNLVILTPPAVVGVAAGWMLAAYVSDAAVQLALGLTSIGFVVFMIIRDRLQRAESQTPSIPAGAFWGALSGFTSFISHSGSPPFMVYVLPQRLPPREFAGTAAMFFAAVNLLKVAPYLALGQFSRENLIASAALLPVAIVSTLAGVWLVKRVSAERFYILILTVTFVVGVKLTYDAVKALI